MNARYDAFVALLALADPPDLPIRGRRFTQPGKLGKDARKLHYERSWLRHRMADLGKEESMIVSVRRSPLRLVARKEA